MKRYKVIGHRRNQPCPSCKKPRFCDGCGLCEGCGFAPPEIAGEDDADGEMPKCAECGHTVLHGRTCSVTLKSLAN